MMEEQLKRIADSLEVIARWDQMQIDWLTEQRSKINVVPVADQVVAEKITEEVPKKTKKFGDTKKMELDEAEEEMTSDCPFDEEEDEVVVRKSLKPKKAAAPKAKAKSVDEDDDDDFFESPKPKKKKVVVEGDDEEDEELPKPVKKEKAKPKKKKVFIDEDDDDDCPF